MLLFTRPGRPEAGAQPAADLPSQLPRGGEPVRIPIEDFIDLHPFPPKDIPDVVRDYIEAAHAAGFREVRLIHGRGIGVQRERIRSLLSSHPLVVSFHDAPPERGGWGATEVSLGD
ncbi:MAG: Smr/MutS family protein [Acidobacteria bacterium]|nr:Smr/MutS family protein [Acidobacteriota bacterium]